MIVKQLNMTIKCGASYLLKQTEVVRHKVNGRVITSIAILLVGILEHRDLIQAEDYS